VRRGLAIAAALGACATSTGGQQVAIDGVVVVDAPVEQRDGAPVIAFPVQGAQAEIAITAAELSVGPLYLWSLPPDLDGDTWARRLAPVPAAWASDQVNAGRLVGEIPSQVRVDLLRDDRVGLGSGSAIEGLARSADVWLEPAPIGPTLHLRGSLQLDGEDLPFAADITWATPWIDEESGTNAVLLRRVRGLPTELALRDDLTIAIAVDPRAWFDATFARGLPQVAPGADGVRRLQPSDVAGRALDFGVRRIGPAGPWRVREGSGP